ncbi:MAG TPA: nickel-dependent lactate racemase [Candidatus Latescibacteria bacterium]|nr:nickel-dependent lactate racemase [Candidatus Latescibacterota bacterium]
MRIKLAYGKTGLPIELDDSLNVTVVEPSFVPALPDPEAAVRDALRAPIGSPPLRDLVRPGKRVGVVFSDITRPAPNPLMLKAVLEALDAIPGVETTFFNALGTHRPNTEAELRGMVGDDIFERRRIVQNDTFDPATQVLAGVTSKGHETWLNAELMACDLKILTGFIEPHLFAGFSGGGKAIMPGMAGQRTVLGNHDAGMVGHPKAIWGLTQGNPIWEEVREVAGQAGRLFLLNVTLNRDKAVTGIFAGNIDQAHAAGCSFVKRSAMVAVPQPFDIVVTTNSGYPLDINLYQSVKGMRAADQIVKPGGAIIIAARCSDGIPEHGLYGKILRESKNPRELLDRICAPGFLEQDQWQAQIQALIQLKADVYVRSDGLSDEQIRGALLIPCHRIEATVDELIKKVGHGASICVMPEGPQTIPYVSAS